MLDGPKLVTISWQCEELVDRDFGDLTFTCSAGNIPDIQEFHQGYFNGVANFELNDQEEKVAISMTGGGYNGYCMWSAEPGTSLDAPIEDGKAAFEGVWLGTDVCEGLQFSFEAIWDEETLAISMNGVIEPAN